MLFDLVDEMVNLSQVPFNKAWVRLGDKFIRCVILYQPYLLLRLVSRLNYFQDVMRIDKLSTILGVNSALHNYLRQGVSAE